VVKEETPTTVKAERAFRERGGLLRTSQALKLGIHPRTLYEMRDSNRIVQLGRGLYRLAEAPETEHLDLITVAARIPDGVICLISALSFHGITTEVPHEVYLAVRHGKEQPRLDYPPLRVFRFSDETISAGVEKYKLEGVTVRLFSPAKTVADCFKFRHKIGVDVAVEALKLCLAQGMTKPAQILYYARLCRVERVIRPYLEALV
jgi:predicted transcriptional regulator of viral defense system